MIGFGSIGSRHARILMELGCDVGVVSRRAIDFSKSYLSLEKALNEHQPDYIVIANRTSEHFLTLKRLQALRFQGIVMVEKPLFGRAERFDPKYFKKVVVGYNLRFHPLIMKLRALLKGRKILTAQTYVGKDLRKWRKNADYRKSYSALKDEGGGVLRDLSHELDYMNWILGGWKAVTAVGGHYSRLAIETDDAYCVMMKTKRCESVLVQMNYVDHAGHRAMIFNSDDLTVKVDLMNGWIEVNGKKQKFESERDQTYRDEHRAVMAGKWNNLCSYEEAMDIMHLIESAEKSSKTEKWVKK